MALVSTGDVRSWLGIATSDTGPNIKIASLIDAVEDFVDGWTNRKLEAAHYNTHPDFCYLDGSGRRWMYLPQYPVSWIGTVYVDHDREFDSATAIGSADLVVYWKEGKLYSEEMPFSKGHRNVKVEYKAGYGDTGSTYPVPNDLKQAIIEMVGLSFKEGATTIHSVSIGEGTTEERPNITKLLESNSILRNTLDEYKNHAAGLAGFWE